ncbi:MAG: TIGR03936 family radical SAM-associated protein [Firmicutes bacterium]|nr:TIGR03936 family radical SAM-associated protein [Bacillota bacterium]
MARLLFEKTGNAVWMSHLDLMRVFQRAFKRAGLPLTHTQGFNPRPSVSIALPLSVGVESRCEMLDFTLDGVQVPCQEIRERLNAALVDGVRVRDVYEGGRKIKALSLLDCQVILEYDRGVADDAVAHIRDLFARESLLLEKRGKKGTSVQDIIPLIRRLQVAKIDVNTLELTARICCQEPALNPAQLTAAIGAYLPEYRPDFARCCRLEVYDSQETIFR